MGHLLMGGTLFLTGELTAARGHLEEAIADYERDRLTDRGRQVLYVQDQKSTGLCYLASALTILGYPDSGLRAAEAGVAHSRALGGLHALNYSLCYLAAVLHLRRDSREALRRATESLELAREQGFASWVGMSMLIRGASLAGMGEFEDGLREIAEGIKAHSAMEAVAYQPFGLSMLAAGLLGAGRLREALEALDRALAITGETGERFYLAELLRLKGEALARGGAAAEAEPWLRQAIGRAREQEAKLLELRSAVSLCRVLQGAPRQAALREILVPVHGWFREGAGAPDLADARAVLAEADCGRIGP
jgi:predicted ATPase